VNDFYLWFSTGLEHIADWKGYDHILFLLALCGVYRLAEWRQLLVLITAFTVGHSVTLALSVLDVVKVHTKTVEFLIPVTIALTCVMNLVDLKKTRRAHAVLRYGAALFFGLIHGLGFSFLLKSLLGSEENLVPPLFAFNLGLEAGQLLIVAIVLLLSAVATVLIHIRETDKNFFVSSAVFGVAVMLVLERFPF
jgi:ABC-type antimicrobial peptide transport system permease subunit